MTTEEIKTLNDLLIKFFDEAKFGSNNFLTRNPIAALLKKHLFDLGYWRNKARNRSPKITDKMFLKKFMEQHKSEIRNTDCPF